MIRVRIDSEKEIQDSTRTKVKEILETSKDVRTSLKEAFPTGFTSYDRRRFILTLGDGRIFTTYIEIEGFQPETMDFEKNPDEILTKTIVDY